ncbi:hypothetical protein [Methylomonas methanica]|uniref:Uncharacterized protein n=1 Tax=Methylomonas methanica (strain DSM 25384 / MC09) TaxID=857087 RepID=F9ZV49_METMM|nr:hypothetical protein [Methylomonas methanica]AEF99482.1 hypothetical protein Metme_1046 [Methylomonas methanica MC09]
MKTNLLANVRMVQKYDSDTTKGINVFCEEENEGLNENLLGPVQLVMGGPLELFTRFQDLFKTGALPGQLEMSVDVGRGAGGKAKLTVLSIKDPLLQAHVNQTNTARIDTDTGEITGTGQPSQQGQSSQAKQDQTNQAKPGNATGQGKGA